MRRSIISSLFTAFAGQALWARLTAAKSVYAHYMVGTVTEGSGHAELDIDQALAMGIDAFALNVGNPTADWTLSTISQLFNHASTNGFKLFFSLDLLQEPDITAFNSLLSNYLGHRSYLRYGAANYPLVSTYSVGPNGPDYFSNWKANDFANEIYFVPNADQSQGYNDPDSWFSAWDQAVQGVLGWETAWPTPGSTPTNVSSSQDSSVLNAAHAWAKTYMAPLSSLQFKDSCGGNYYRVGESNLPQRMTQLLDLAPDFVEILTWNDAGESHYIGNIWPEGVGSDALAYSNNQDWPHSAWRPIIQSFIAAYKGGQDASAMAPTSGAQAIGAMWYRDIPKGAACGGNQKPDNWPSAVDAVNYAVVVAPGNTGITIRVTSGGTVIRTITGNYGLNYGSATGLNTGAQKLEVLSGSTVILTANSARDVNSDDPACIFNYQVAGLK
ncbi:glycoside hydrolase [Coniochaeta sp. 2T2.1]|nr:glycoside hydrolase [Coniochaeta sp. 2T2.1]